MNKTLNLQIPFTNTRVFVTVYSIVLGIPFAIAFGFREQLSATVGELWWMVPLVAATLLATGGSIIFLYIQRKAEDRLLKEQRKYQETLRQASSGMGQVRDLKKLLQLIVRVVTKTVKIRHCSIFLFHESSGNYILKAVRNRKNISEENCVIHGDSAMVKHLIKNNEPLIYKNIENHFKDRNQKEYSEIRSAMDKLHAELVLPSFIEEKLIAIFILGKKISGDEYTSDDMALFLILSNQSALSIENAQFYEDMKRTHEQLFKAEKMATIGTMADGLSHQINNRLHAMGFIAGDAIDSINLKNANVKSDVTKKILGESKHSLERIVDNVKRGGEIVEGLLKYTRKGEEGFLPIELGKLLDASIEMVQYKIKIKEINIARKLPRDIPKINGNFTQLQEVFFNIIDNSYDAMMQRKNELKEEGFKALLEITAEKGEGELIIYFKDNGIGVKSEDSSKLFTPFFSTKVANKKGTGLGLYVIKQIVEENHGGKVIFTTEYCKGSHTEIHLPAV